MTTVYAPQISAPESISRAYLATAGSSGSSHSNQGLDIAKCCVPKDGAILTKTPKHPLSLETIREGEHEAKRCDIARVVTPSPPPTRNYSGVVLSPANPEQAQALLPSFTDCYVDAFSGAPYFFDMDRDSSRNEIVERIHDPKSVCFALTVDHDGETTAGFVMGKQIEHRHKQLVYVDAVGVSSQFRGGGTGSMLLDEFIDALPAHTDGVYLTTATNNPRAIHFYKKNGFEELNLKGLCVNYVQRDDNHSEYDIEKKVFFFKPLTASYPAHRFEKALRTSEYVHNSSIISVMGRKIGLFFGAEQHPQHYRSSTLAQFDQSHNQPAKEVDTLCVIKPPSTPDCLFEIQLRSKMDYHLVPGVIYAACSSEIPAPAHFSGRVEVNTDPHAASRGERQVLSFAANDSELFVKGFRAWPRGALETEYRGPLVTTAKPNDA